MLVATFAPSSEWAGKTIKYEGDRFIVEGRGPISGDDLRKHARAGELTWSSDEARMWAVSKMTEQAPPDRGAVAEESAQKEPAQKEPAQTSSATCGCVFLIVILAVVIGGSFWACKSCGNKEAPPASQVTSGATASSSTSAVAVSTSPTPSETTSPSPVTSPSPSPTAQYAIDELTGFWVTYTGTDITLQAQKNGDNLSAVLNVAPRPQVYLKPLRVSADTFRGKASTLTKDYVYLHFRNPKVLVIWFTAADGSKVRGTLHRNTIEPSDNGANYVGPSASGGNYADGGGQSAGQTYTMAQYAQLVPGMTYTEVDAIMGGGGIMVAQEGVLSMLIYQNVDAAGSQIKCTFEYDILVECSEAGL